MFRQVLDPVGGSLGWSALVAAIPLVGLLVLLGVFRVRSHWAALSALAASLLVAVAAFGMPAGQAGSAALEGAAFGVFPIVWIVLNAVWINRLIQDSGHLDVLRRAFMAISDDYRVQALIIAFCFGSLIESVSGFGAPVAIVAAMLLALGFPPVRAAVVALFSDAAGAAFGSVGTPIAVLEKATGLPAADLGAMIGRQSPFVAFFVPFLLLIILDGRRGLRDLWPVALATGLGFAIGQFAAAEFVAYEIADLVGAVGATAVVLLLLRVWSPARPIAGSAGPPPPLVAGGAVDDPGFRARDGAPRVLRAFSPYVILTALLVVFSLPGPAQRAVAALTTEFDWPGLHVATPTGKTPSVIAFSIEWVGATGTMLFITGVLASFVLGMRPRAAARAYLGALRQIRFAGLTVALVLALAYVLSLSGGALTIGHGLAAAGRVFVPLSGALGWLGVAATGSDSSANSLFGAVQVAAAGKLDLSPYLLAAANSEGGVIGKVISPQNLAMATAAVGMAGREGDLLRRTIGWSLLSLAGFALLITLQASPVLSWMVIGHP
ncbi:MAG TPA: L-lactate permease [Streptosporangiaceae bacterium]|jgi:lactate permease